jgi:hypothetical protein
MEGGERGKKNKEKKKSTLQGAGHQKKIYREEKKLTYIARG